MASTDAPAVDITEDDPDPGEEQPDIHDGDDGGGQVMANDAFDDGGDDVCYHDDRIHQRCHPSSDCAIPRYKAAKTEETTS